MGKNQHYVPQFYLKLFSNNSHSIGAWNEKTNKIIEHASIINMASKNNLYGENQIVEKWLSSLESKWSVLIHNVIADSKINSFKDYTLMLFFIAISHARTLRIAEESTYELNYMANLLSKGKHLGKDIEELKLYMDIPNLVPLQLAPEITTSLSDLRYIIIENFTSACFITSDSPVCLYNKLYAVRRYHRNYGFGAGGLIILLPLSPQKCLCLFDAMVYNCGGLYSFRLKSSSQATEINKLIARNAFRNIFFNNQQKRSYINNIVKYHKHIDLKDYVKELFNGSIIQTGEERIHEIYKLDFLEIKEEFLKMELPMHMGGLTRPYAERWINKRLK